MFFVFGTLAPSSLTLALWVVAKKYKEELAVYAGRYRVSLRTVKRWASKNAPFDEPLRMGAWWSANMTQRCPDEILAAGAELPLKVEVVAPSIMEVVPVGDHEIGISATLKRLGNAEVQAHRMFETAVANKDEGGAKLAQKLWTDISAQVRTMTKAAREEEVQQGMLAPVQLLEQQLVQLHAEILGQFRGMFPLIQRTFHVPVDGEAQWLAIVDEVCEGLNKEVFRVSE